MVSLQTPCIFESVIEYLRGKNPRKNVWKYTYSHLRLAMRGIPELEDRSELDVYGAALMGFIGLIECSSYSPYAVVHFAALRGHRELVEMMLEKIPKIHENHHKYNLLGIMFEAEKAGHADIVELLIDHDKQCLNRALRQAAGNGQMDRFFAMVEKGATKFDKALIEAAKGGHTHIIRHIIDNGLLKKPEKTRKLAMKSAAYEGHLDCIIYMLNQGATDFVDSVIAAGRCGHEDIVRLLIGRERMHIARIKIIVEQHHEEIAHLIDMHERMRQVHNEFRHNREVSRSTWRQLRRVNHELVYIFAKHSEEPVYSEECEFYEHYHNLVRQERLPKFMRSMRFYCLRRVHVKSLRDLSYCTKPSDMQFYRGEVPYHRTLYERRKDEAR